MGRKGAARASAMQSPVNWALLGLVVERPSYAYELARRFERTYEGALSLSSVSHVYTALGTLESRGLVEEVPGSRSGRQPKPRYRATDAGMDSYREWLVHQLGDERRRQRLFILQLGALAADPEAALEVIARYEQACLAEATEPAAPSAEAGSADAVGLVGRLTCEERRLGVGAKLAWIEYARREIKAFAERPSRRP